MKLTLALVLVASTAFADTELGRAEIKAGMDKVKADVDACGQAYTKVKGIVKVRVVVAPDGHVEKASFYVSPDRALGACVASAIQHKASFATSAHGATFEYPYVF